ncbi:MAG: hypothetical protein UX25_C0022G0006 [Candidatus Woesebacteria bacterium GW2011_GWC2_45_9]|uniref:Integral membrane protein n=2 Tax=Microgenomates group TaxID=1794810 RepID=A0A0G1N963_9BACT|nr:MAG: hypothetical protein UW61_C0008G0005 [Candidatus Curtissbacteria bacterium GW2011_GWC1_44_33]KKU16877.1 MAG: hypothetical protein UX25_C0022G0006 [Candidatus Woesebacteria bacterium GW2011_GWC2_45_9]
MRNLLTQVNLAPEGGFKGIGPLGLDEGQSPLGVFTQFISSAIGLMTIIAIIWFIFVLISGAIGIISAGGDKASLESARKRITTGIIGLVVVVAGIFIIDLIGSLIGIDVLNIEDLVNKLPIGGGK